MKIKLVENVLKVNDELAAMNRRMLHDAGIFTVDLIGAPGCGKTALLEATIQAMRGRWRIGVIAGDLATQRDAERMARWGSDVVQINTGKGCHLEANHVRQAIDSLDLKALDLLFIENVGNLICPVGFDLGQDAKVGMFCVAGGDDKAAKHPYLVYESSLLILNKIDLLPHVPFRRDIFMEDVNRLNPRAELIELSAATGEAMERWTQWLSQRLLARFERAATG
jgi:hydrogenase nickel incorporation protein HypB